MVQANRVNTAAVFLDLRKAYDNVSVPSVTQCLRGYGLSGNILTFLKAYLNSRTIRVKLGSTISRERPLHRVHHHGTGGPRCTQRCVVNNLCIWTTSFKVQPMVCVLQGALNALSAAVWQHG